MIHWVVPMLMGRSPKIAAMAKLAKDKLMDGRGPVSHILR
jgi:hypothetical protein